jgi:hypothetical protein
MGSAARTTSTAQTSTQVRGKREMNAAVESNNLKRAADIGITVLLATQPNGPAKVPMYSYAKHTATFLDAASKDGVEAGITATGSSVIKSQIGGGYANMTIASVSR